MNCRRLHLRDQRSNTEWLMCGHLKKGASLPWIIIGPYQAKYDRLKNRVLAPQTIKVSN